MLTKEILLANSTLAGLSAEQLEAISTQTAGLHNNHFAQSQRRAYGSRTRKEKKVNNQTNKKHKGHAYKRNIIS